VTICDLRKALIPPTSYFSASGIRIHYLTAGDSYNLATGLVTSNKSKITAPYYSSHTDSNDILAGYEASLLTTRLVDQKELYNLGKTRIPSAFPISTPSFELKFYKDSQTMGYYSDRKYTATNVLLDFSFGAKVNNLST
jgi:cyanophycinase